MSTQREIAISKEGFNFVPQTLQEAQEYATIFASSGLCPEGYRGRPNDILIVWQMGKELGLEKMQALRTLGCINGMPFAYGDGLLALVKRHRDFEDMKEWKEGDLAKGTLTAYCTIKRKGKEPVTQPFSIEDAKRAGLWGKGVAWTKYPARMLQHRARGFAARDAFPDALYGLMSEDEARGVADSSVVIDMPKPKGKGMQGLEESLGIQEENQTIIEAEFTHEPVNVEPEQSNDDTINELLALIEEKNVPKQNVEKWCKKFNVDVVENIPIESVKEIINRIKEKL